MQTTTVHYWRVFAFALGSVAATLGCFGAYEYALKLEGGQISYLVVAGPVVAASAALIPGIAEAMWRQRQVVKALLWWVVLLPAAAVVFFSAAERVHVAKAGAKAERGALSSAAARAQDDLKQAKANLAEAKTEADKTRSWKKCGPQCLGIRDAETARQRDVEAAEAKLLSAEQKATEEAPIQAPVWLLPAALDLIAFMAIWTGLAGPWIERQSPAPAAPQAVKARVKLKRKLKAPVGPRSAKLRLIPKMAANDRVSSLRSVNALHEPD